MPSRKPRPQIRPVKGPRPYDPLMGSTSSRTTTARPAKAARPKAGLRIGYARVSTDEQDLAA